MLAVAGVVFAVLLAWRAGAPVPAPVGGADPVTGVSNPMASSAMAPAGMDSDLAIARAVAAQQSMLAAERALQAANDVLSAPEIPERAMIWTAAGDEGDLPTLALNADIPHAEVVHLPEPQALEKVPGDRLSVPLIGGRMLAVTVEEAARLPSGDYTWRGYVDGEGDDFPVIFTVGKNSAFATITSWEGSYTMESIDGVGWLYRNIVDRGEDSVPAPAGERGL
jgi:hypothetical protein